VCDYVSLLCFQLSSDIYFGQAEYSVLHNSVIGGQFECVRYLIENGANLHAKGTDVETVLYYAAARGLYKILKFLVAHGADVNVVSRVSGSFSNNDLSQIVTFIVWNNSCVNSIRRWSL
jgi:ankyrin repeat protein